MNTSLGFQKKRRPEQIRVTIKKAAPSAEEKISYDIPTFTLKGTYPIYFAGYKKHIGIYPVGVEEFNEAFPNYKTRKGTFKFLSITPYRNN
jgi:uncharacterized protein YdhG (YjbR/CyaY superfamily)